MASYLASFWRNITGGDRAPFNEADFLDALRPRYVLRTPRRLPATPTRSHHPPKRTEVPNNGKKSKQCPHCRKTFYVEVPSGRVTKPLAARRRGRKPGSKRWVSVRDAYKIEDLSPTLSAKGYQADGEVSEEEVGVTTRGAVTRAKRAGRKSGVRRTL